MKFLLIDIQDIKPIYGNKKYIIDEKHSIDELILGNKYIKQISKKKTFLANRITKLYEVKLKRKINKVLNLNKTNKDNDEKWYYILSNKVVENNALTKYVLELLNKLGGKKYLSVSEMNANIYKYIEEYKKNEHEIKVLFVYKDNNSINFDVIEKAITKYKKVNIYLFEKATSTIINRIVKINNQEGTSIELVKYSKKAFLEYDVIYFVDDMRMNHPRMRIPKSSLIIDMQDTMSDKYNSNVIFYNKINKMDEQLDKLIDKYGLISIASAVRKIVN